MPGSRPAANQLTVTNTQGDPQAAQFLKLLLIHQRRYRTIHDIAEKVEIGYGTYRWVLTKELGIHYVTAKFVPRILKLQCIDILT
jgi:hypothetical protein